MNRLPPTPPSRHFIPLGPRRLRVAAMVLVMAFAVGGCDQAHPDARVAGLVIASNGTIRVTVVEGQPEAIAGPVGGARRVTASNGRIVAETADHGLFVSDGRGVGAARAWRPLAPEGPSSRTPSGIDLSADGRTLAIVLGDPDTPGLELVTIDVETDAATTLAIDMMANGPPSWLGPDLLALEVIRPDQHSGIATVDLKTGGVKVTDAQGFALSATRDGSRIALAEATSGLITITDRKDWLAGVPGDALGITSPTESTIQDVAINADGSRLAIAYAANSGATWSVVILRLNRRVWETVSSISIPGDAAVSIDWLD
jgi:hypothetical protein